MCDPLVALSDRLIEELNEGKEERLQLIRRDDGRMLVRCADLKDWLTELKETKCRKVAIHELLQGCEVYFEPLPTPSRNPELVARLERLKTEQDQRDYDRMVENVSLGVLSKKHLGTSAVSEIRQSQRQLGLVVNFVITVVGAFFFGYYACYSIAEFTGRMIGGLIFAFVVFFVDLYFLTKQV